MKNDRVFIIAEAGVNHNGSLDLGCECIELAKKAGADAVKFQTFLADRLVSKKAEKAEYQKRLTKKQESHYEMIKRLELSESDHKILIRHAKQHKIKFLSSPFDEKSADLLARLKMDLFKIPSGEVINHRFLKHIAGIKKPVILSTGMCKLSEVEEAVEILLNNGCPDLSLLHCVTEYPAPYSEINLRAMDTLAAAFGLRVGYSDHSPGIEIALAAVARGAKIIEKHFTVNRNLPGPDHQASLEPGELGLMVESVRNIEKSLGNGIKRPAPSELKNIPIARKSIVLAKSIKKGQIIKASSIACKRPGYGIEPKYFDLITGRRVRRSMKAESVLHWKDLL